jgi:hypothetical protein
MDTIYHMAMLLLGYFALFSAHRAGLAHLKMRKQGLQSHQPISYTTSTNVWISMVTWLGISVISLILVFKIAP